MSKEGELWRAAGSLVEQTRNVIMSTADATGAPHAMWMTVMADRSMEEVVSITAPTTQKVANLQENPKAEWMFGSVSLESLVYLSGPTEILTGDEAQTYWDKMPDKSKAYYQIYCDTDDHSQFVVLRTKVEKVVYCRPPGYRKTTVHEITPED